MSEDNNAQVEQEVSVVENETESVDQSAQDNNEVGSLIAESKKYRTRAQSAEAELKELKENQKLQEQKRLEEKEEYKSLYEDVKSENEKLKPIVETFKIQDQKRRENLLDQLPDEDREIYQDLSTNKLEAHVGKLKNAKIQVESGKEVTSSGKWASATKFKDLSKEDQEKAKRNPKLWKQFVEGYR